MKACAIYAARDLRIIEHTDQTRLGADQVRVQYKSGGICGSDIHYFYEGRVGNFAVKEPLIIGHEVSGQVVETGANISRLTPGQKVAINPNLPCMQCDYCIHGKTNLCEQMVFFGSAAVFPHIQGGFREELIVPQSQCVPIPDDMAYTTAAFAEPLAICMHAVNRASPVMHKRILITGCGPIGCLTIMVANMGGCLHITATDLEDVVLKRARDAGADETINIIKQEENLKDYEAGRGTFDIAFECSGNPKALQTCLNAVKPQGKIIQIGMMPQGENPVAVNKLLSKEILLTGTFRFHDEFEQAVETLISGKLDVQALLTGVFKFGDAEEAFAAAIDRSKHMKIQLQWETQ